MISRHFLCFLLVVGLGLLPAAARAQLPARELPASELPASGFDDMVEVKEVLLDVLALDESGKIVLGLGKDDFVVEEDGTAVDITGVDFYTSYYGPDGTITTGDGVVPSSRFFILFFHDPIAGRSIGSYRVRQREKARRGCLTWVQEHLAPADWVAVVGYDVRLKVHQDFTQDVFAIGEAINRAARRLSPEREWGRHGPRLPPSGAPSLLRHLPRDRALRQQSKSVYDGLHLLAEVAGFTVGRKNLMMFTSGIGELDFTGLTAQGDSVRYPPMERALNDHNIAVYPIDFTPPEVRHVQGQLLRRLAITTGGQYFRSPIHYLTPLRRVTEETVGYYLISYQSERAASASGYQPVEVTSRDPAIRLRARRGYRYGTN